MAAKKGSQLDLLELFEWLLYCGHLILEGPICTPEARQVPRNSQEARCAAFVEAGDIGRAQLADPERIRPESFRPQVRNITRSGSVEHIEIRAQVEIHTRGSQLAAQNGSHSLRQFGIPGGPKCHRSRQIGSTGHELRRGSACISSLGADQKRHER